MVVICTTCGNCLGDRIKLFDALWKLIESRSRGKYTSITMENLGQVQRNIEMGALMDALHISLDCCRSSIMSHINPKQTIEFDVNGSKK